jgi:hypothetical protein
MYIFMYIVIIILVISKVSKKLPTAPNSCQNFPERALGAAFASWKLWGAFGSILRAYFYGIPRAVSRSCMYIFMCIVIIIVVNRKAPEKLPTAPKTSQNLRRHALGAAIASWKLWGALGSILRAYFYWNP